MNGIRFASKEYPKLDDDALYDLICNLHWQLQHRQPNGPSWLGYGMSQWPLDLISYQELLWKVKPQLIIETGTAGGGCTLFFASILDFMRVIDYKILTVDFPSNQTNPDTLKHPHIIYIQGNSESAEVVGRVRSYWNPDKSTMVFLDSSHDQPHVSVEMETYHSLVSVGSYMVVEDTWLGYSLPCQPGPLAAVKQFLEKHDGWTIDSFPERWLCSQNPCGYLKKVS